MFVEIKSLQICYTEIIGGKLVAFSEIIEVFLYMISLDKI